MPDLSLLGSGHSPRRGRTSRSAQPKGRPPFRIVPWDDDFLLRIHALADELTGGRPGKAVIVFPLNRPRRYLLDIYRKHADRPTMLPHIVNAGQLIQLCLESWTRTVPRMAGTLDQVALVKESVQAVASSAPAGSPLARLARDLEAEDGMARFFPWGVRLARLLDECAGHMVDASDLLHVEDMVSDYAAALLGSLRSIQEDYRARIVGRGMSTPGLESQRAALMAGASPDLPLKLQGRKVIIAGFVRLTASEDRLFRYLWEQGAEICLHTDPGILENAGHWSCGEHRAWLKRWKAHGLLMGESRNMEQEMHFFAGYDLHSQLRELQKELERAPHEGESRAVVISHDSLLMPTLHHIPEKNINISLGYPLERSLLARLVERILQVRESMDGQGRVRWKPLMDLMRHPYVRMLCTAGESADGTQKLGAQNTGLNTHPLRPFLMHMEYALRKGKRMVDAAALTADLLDDVLGDLDREAKGLPPLDGVNETNGALLADVVDILVSRWREVKTLGDLADSLRALCQLLLEHGRHIWPNFPLDAECLARLMQNVIPELADNALCRETLSLESLFSILRQSIAEQRVPFEADPLTGLQILGTLETRLLRFDRVYLLDLTEDALPGSPARDPLLPDSLRDMLGLPDSDRRDMLAAHTFHRLLAGAKEVFLYWQEGVQSSGVMDAKKQRSRFVEEAVWRVEQREGRRLQAGEGPLRSAAFPVSPPPAADERAIPRTADIDRRMEELLKKTLSPSRLDEYLSCPVRFFHRYVCSLKDMDDVPEGDDYPAVGTMLHRVLYRAFEPYLGRFLHAGDISEERLDALFREELLASGLCDSLPAQSRFMLEAAGPHRLHDFLAHQPELTEVLQLEQDSSAELMAGERRFVLGGQIDRLDRREQGLVILDYKSGRTSRSPRREFWNDEPLWQAMREWQPGMADPLPDLADSLPSLQLPCYLYICGHDPKNAALLRLSPLADAAWVQLADGGEELSLMGTAVDEEERRSIIEERIPELLNFVLRHMAEAREFRPRRTPSCERCPYRKTCGR
ncbi:MAG: PD-(D/E)XK nuclease family protein [Mailhella sp.]|nr:PD-(D/E)XK nuclease family protein [Mailhella sp.]